MDSVKKGKVTYEVMQRLLERAWDEEDQATMETLSQAIDEATWRIMTENNAFESDTMQEQIRLIEK